MKLIRQFALAIGGIATAFALMGAAVDTDGNAITSSTDLGDIDMDATTVGDFQEVIAPGYSNIAASIASKVSADNVTNLVWDIYLTSHLYFYDTYTQTTYKQIIQNDYYLLIAVTNVPPSYEVIRALESDD